MEQSPICRWSFVEKYIENHPRVLCFCAGMCGALGFAPFNIFPIFLGIFAWFLSKAFKKTASYCDILLFFTGFYLANLYWIAFPLTFEPIYFWLIPLALLAIPICMAALMLPGFWIARNCNPKYRFFVFPIVYTLTLWFLGSIFPWVLPAYIWNFHEIFMQTLCIYGVYGLSFITMLLTSLLAEAIIHHENKESQKTSKYLLCASGIFLSMCIFGGYRLSKKPTEYTSIAVHAVQQNVSDKEKSANRRSVLNKLVELSKSKNNADLLLWPEASIPYLYQENLKRLHKIISSKLINEDSILMAGAVRRDNADNIYNSAVFVNKHGINIGNYDKAHLVPFGEYIPFRGFLPDFLRSIASNIGDFARGNSDRVPISIKFDSGRLKIAIAICYEAVFGEECAEYCDPSNPKANSADVMINLTNDGWFGFTSQPYQHLQIVRARAIEMGIPLIRVANIGISAVFDPLGRELARIPLGKSGNIEFFIPEKMKGSTPFCILCGYLKKAKNTLRLW